VARNAVGSLAVMITANASAFDSTLTGVMRRVREFGGGFRAASGVAAGVGGLAGIGSAGAALLKVLDTIDDRAKLGAAGKAFGLTAEQFTGVAAVARFAGEGSREFIESLVTLGKVVDDGIAGRGEVAGDFFRTIGVEAKAFAGLRADQQFFKVFDALGKMQDPLQRVRALMVAFGEDGGKALLPLLAMAPGELRKMAAESAVTSDRMRDLEAAQRGVNSAGKEWEQVWTRVAGSIAPVVEAVLKLVGGVGKLGPELEQLKRVADTDAGRGAGTLAKLGDFGRNVAGVVGATAGRITTGAGHGIATLDRISPAGRTQWADLAERMIGAGRDVTARGQSMLGSKIAPGMESAFAAVDARRAREAASAGRAGTGPAGRPRINPADMARVSGFGDAIRGKFSGVKPQKDEWESIFGSVKMSPLEQFRNTQRLVGMGMADQPANAALGNQILANAFMELESSLDKMTNDIPAAVQAGTAEAESAISRAMLSDPTNQGIDRVADILQRAEEREKKQARDIGRIADELAGKDPVKVVKIGG
jgi:hypothetical protein